MVQSMRDIENQRGARFDSRLDSSDGARSTELEFAEDPTADKPSSSKDSDNSPCCILAPHCEYLKISDTVMGLVCAMFLLSALMALLNKDSQLESVAAVVGFIFIFVSIVDMIHNFRTAFFHPGASGKLIIDPTRISRRYLLSFFLFDLVTTTVDLIATALRAAGLGTRLFEFLTFLKALRWLRLVFSLRARSRIRGTYGTAPGTGAAALVLLAELLAEAPTPFVALSGRPQTLAGRFKELDDAREGGLLSQEQWVLARRLALGKFNRQLQLTQRLEEIDSRRASGGIDQNQWTIDRVNAVAQSDYEHELTERFRELDERKAEGRISEDQWIVARRVALAKMNRGQREDTKFDA
mmetsp:Transcript_62152/g.140586  ORF Transcript_62152/g.140586 Transcript_62152/m.140586 type:complete len:354 (-) Transcript_62152:84-1145(-)|eukprot:CAMPEP_0172634844 /NCGR_PEP_ID=MMETSP1068-20121228/196438_1 /TAXON_ID=35684 /ORGANISM="Pseudopedinella elastica, Strain CCMP716" /LENGTH=353 /DNA_ID=CAMNT_0013446867 /DNA_START=144 /DNA_END=1205 /DNA_ORIENTATION=-